MTNHGSIPAHLNNQQWNESNWHNHDVPPVTHLAPIEPQPLPGHARVGTCSLCGGDVIGHRGAWWGITPPPPDQCLRCQAVRADRDDVIPMRKP